MTGPHIPFQLHIQLLSLLQPHWLLNFFNLLLSPLHILPPLLGMRLSLPILPDNTDKLKLIPY